MRLAFCLVLLGAVLFAGGTRASTIVYIPCGASIDAFTASVANGGNGVYGSGVVFQLAGAPDRPCTYAGQTFHTQSGETIEGDCSSALGRNTILDGTGVSAGTPLTDGHGDGSTGVTMQCLTVQHYTLTHTANCTSNQIATGDGWVLTKDTFAAGGCIGVDLKGNASLSNSRIVGNGTEGVFSEPGYSTNPAAVQTVIGNEIGWNGSPDSIGNTAAGLKSVPSACAESAVATQGTSIDFNWVHDNTGVGIWWDCWSGNAAAIGNTVDRNGAAGIMCEISVGCTIEANVLHDNGADQQLFQGDIFVASSSNATVEGNFIAVNPRWSRNGGAIVQAQCRGDVPQAEAADLVTGNTIVFEGFTSGQGVVGQIDSTNLGANCPSDKFPVSWGYYAASQNTFWSAATSDPHWTGNALGYGTSASLAAIQGSPYSNDAGSMIGTAGAPTAAGCTAVSCTGSGWSGLAPQSAGLQSTAAACLQATPGNCLGASPAARPAVTYHIATTGTDGAGCGTSISPCATPNGVAANNALVCGSVIGAAAGTYSQSAMRITAAPSCPAQNDVVMIECATPFACSGTTFIQIEASYWGLEGWTMTSTSHACYLVQPPGTAPIGTIAIVDNICNGASQGGIVYYQASASVGNTVTIGNIVYNAAQATSGCDTGITHGSMGNFLPTGDELYAAWNFSYGNETAGTSCNGGTDADQTGLNFDTMGNYSGLSVAENNWLGWNGGPGFELTSGNSTLNAGPVIVRYNTLVANAQWPYLAGGSITDFLGGIVGVGGQNGTYVYNLVDGTSTVSGAVGLQYYPKNTPLSVMDDNWLYQSVSGHGNNYWGDSSGCLAGHTSPIGPFTNASNTGCAGNSFTTDPVLASLTEPAAPSCGGQTDTLACFAVQIANLRSSVAGSTDWGAQVAAPTDAYNTTAFLCHVYHEMPATMFEAAGGPIPNRC